MSLLSRFFYSVLLCLLTPVLVAYLLLRSRKDRGYRQRFAERFALQLPAKALSGAIVVHTVSVGEFNAAKGLIKQLLQQYPQLPLLISCTTPTASAAISVFSAEQRQQGRTVEHCYLPFDYPFLLRRWLKALQPSLFIILETELWPNLLAGCQALGIPSVVANARLSARSARGYRRWHWFIKPMLANISLILTQDIASARRFSALGALQVQPVGNLKYELQIPPASTALADSIRPQVAKRVVWVAASTHAGEDEIVLQAFAELKTQLPQLLLILVPRHPERFDSVASLLQQHQLAFVRRSSAQQLADDTDVWLGDSMGELLSWYQLADIVFIGGSLIERGGHNPLEAMAFAKPVLAGPHVFNFQQVFSLLQRQQAYLQVTDAASLVSTIHSLVRQPALAQQLGDKGLLLYKQQQGALSCTMVQLKAVLPPDLITVRQAQAVGWFDKSFFSGPALAYFNPAYWQKNGLVTGVSTGRNTVYFIADDAKQMVLRHYYRGGLMGKLNRDLFWPVAPRQSRAMVEFSLLWQMHCWGLPVPKPCAALYQPRQIFGLNYGYQADILIERIAGATDLSQLLQQQALTDAQWQQLGSIIARFHQRKVYHSDLNCHNILLDTDGHFWLIDFDKCALRSSGDWQSANLARLQRSLQKESRIYTNFHWHEQCWPVLLRGYQQQLNHNK